MQAGAVLALAVLTLSALVVVPALAAQTTNVKITPSDDAYVAADLNDNGTDKLGLRSLNTGNLPILKVWYAWNLTIVNKTGNVVGYVPVKIVTLTYFRFDLSSIPSGSSVTNATLELYSQNSNLTGASRFLVAYYVRNNSWSQSTMDWYTAPSFDSKVNTSMSVTNGVDGWYALPLTRLVQNATGSTLSIALTFLVLYQHNEEQVVFNSTRASGSQPYLSVTYVGSAPFSLGGMFDFSQGINSVNLVGIAVLVAVVLILAFVLWWWMRRTRGGKPGQQKTKPKPAKGPESQAAGAALAKGAKCVNCGTLVQSDFRLCPNCGKELSEVSCGNCGKVIKVGSKVCPYCGNGLG